MSPDQPSVGLQQRVLPAYREALFDALGEKLGGSLSIFAGQPLKVEGIAISDRLTKAKYFPARNWHFQDPSSPYYICWQFGLMEWLHYWDPQVLIVEANPRYLSTRKAINWMHRKGRPVLGWGLGAPPIRGWLGKVREAERTQLLQNLDGIIAYSHYGAREYQLNGFQPDQIFVAPNAVTFRPTWSPPQRPDKLAGSPVVLFVGRLQDRKRVDHLLSACAALPEGKKPRLIIVGDGPSRTQLQLMASQIYPETEIVGEKRGNELIDYFILADLFILPGTGGLAVQQALSYALPVIVAKGDGTQDMLATQKNGWLIPPDDIISLTKTMDEALSNISKLRKMGLESFRIAMEEVNLEKMVDVFYQAITTVKYSRG